ncbi:YwmB family TATA-box binding protein [Moorella naiadis]|uniref:YwmB family TATA-box binding protein n=1 Tax=Moorella naiadis (nom. illeg.) TaxID=3093670 RepID=UPI003D9C9F4F
MFWSRFHLKTTYLLKFKAAGRKVTFTSLLVALLVLSLAGGLLASHLFLPRVVRSPLAGATVSAGQAGSSGQPAAGDEVTPRLLFTALSASGARLESLHLEAWGRLNTSFSDAATISDLAQQALTGLGLDPGAGAGLTHQDTEKFHGTAWEGELQPGVKLFLSVQSLAGSGADGETYLLLDLTGAPQNGEGEMVSWQGQVRAAFQAWQVEPHLTYGLIGVIPGKLSAAARQQRARAVLAALGARKVEGVEDDELLSISAYSDRLPRGLAVAGREVNVNVALRFHATDGNTYLHLGSPLLGGEY